MGPRDELVLYFDFLPVCVGSGVFVVHVHPEHWGQ